MAGEWYTCVTSFPIVNFNSKKSEDSFTHWISKASNAWIRRADGFSGAPFAMDDMRFIA